MALSRSFRSLTSIVGLLALLVPTYASEAVILGTAIPIVCARRTSACADIREQIYLPPLRELTRTPASSNSRSSN
jgi:hypothetical protein